LGTVLQERILNISHVIYIYICIMHWILYILYIYITLNSMCIL
jgi:hypothetical protein